MEPQSLVERPQAVVGTEKTTTETTAARVGKAKLGTPHSAEPYFESPNTFEGFEDVENTPVLAEAKRKSLGPLFDIGIPPASISSSEREFLASRSARK